MGQSGMSMKVTAHLHLVRDVPSGHGSLTFFWLRATPVIVSCFVGRTWKITRDIPNRLSY